MLVSPFTECDFLITDQDCSQLAAVMAHLPLFILMLSGALSSYPGRPMIFLHGIGFRFATDGDGTIVLMTVDHNLVDPSVRRISRA
jgi:hypothetical protein